MQNRRRSMAVFLTSIFPGLGQLYNRERPKGVACLVVGVVLTVVRARQNSVASSFIVHAVYNGVQMGLAFVATRGFQHLDKLAQ